MSAEDEVVDIFRALTNVNQQALLSFASYLRLQQANGEQAIGSVDQPLDCPRPANETVAGALKRLRKTYFMLDPSALLGKASSLMSEHLLNGRDAVEVIDDLESLFAEMYSEYCLGLIDK